MDKIIIKLKGRLDSRIETQTCNFNLESIFDTKSFILYM